MNVITLLNEKGGVGKTTLSVHLAAGLAMKGQRVVLIDADSQGHSTSQLHAEKQNGLYALLIQDAEWATVMRPVAPGCYSIGGQSSGELWICPANHEIRAIPMLTDKHGALLERVRELEGWADTVVIDTSPAVSMLHAIIYVATDAIIYPTQNEMLSLEGLNDSLNHMEKLNSARILNEQGPINLLGIQPTMYDVRTNAHDYGLSLLTGRFKRKIWPAIPKRTIWRDAAFARQTIYAYDTKDFAAKDHALAETLAMVERVEKGLTA